MPVYYTNAEKQQIANERGVLVDEQDAWLLEEYTWFINEDGYPITGLPRDANGRKATMFLHHCIMGQPIWNGDEIDHINRIPRDCRRSNLRYATRSVNRINTSRAVGPSGERNIYLKADGRYYVRIRRDKVEHFVGSFTALDEAVAARDTWLNQHVVE